LPNGKALILGANSKNGLYDPATNAISLAADTLPAGYGHGDTFATVEPNGKVLTVASNDMGGNGRGAFTFSEYDPVTNSWDPSVPMPPFPPGVGFTAADGIKMVDLPDGKVLVTGGNDGSFWIYAPTGAPQDTWRPAIVDVTGPSANQFQLQGT